MQIGFGIKMNWYRTAVNEIKEYLGSIKGVWILPNGKTADVTFGGHDEYVRNNPTQFGFTSDDMKKAIKSGEYKDAYEMAFSKGAVRLDIVVKNGEANICGSKQAIKRNALTIQDMLNNGNVNKVIVEVFDLNSVSAYTSSFYRSRNDFMRDYL